MIFPSLDRVKAIAPGYDIVPVYMEILSDVRTPISVLKAFKSTRSTVFDSHFMVFAEELNLRIVA